MTTAHDHSASPWIVAHRGAMDEAPENTGAAFDAALAYPIDGIELDVQMTKDAALVLFHDADLSRISGEPKAIRDCDLDALRALDWGGWHSEAFRGEKLLTLSELIERYVSKTRLLIEIKSFEEDRRTGRSLDTASRVLDVLRDRVPEKHIANILILSFDPELLLHVHDRSEWKLVLNTASPQNSAAAGRVAEHLYAGSAAIDTLDRSTVRHWHDAGKSVMTRGCNTPEQVQRARAFGCDVIMTDRPRWILDYLQSNR